MADGSYRIPGGAPAPDPARVAQLADGLTPSADFGAEAEAAATDCLARLGEAARAKGADCADLIAGVRDRMTRLAPQSLVPRRGLAGLFDSPGKRLKAFRAAFRDGGGALAGLSSGLGERAGDIDRLTAGLDALADDLRAAVAALGEQVAAAREWLSRQAEEVEGLADFRARLQALEARLAATVRALPLVRALQNADARVREGLIAAPMMIEAWRTDWTGHLGLDRKRPRKVRPAPEALAPARDAVEAALGRIETEWTRAAQRRREIADRLA